jgi:Mn-dependent DtxR family transcriptional regulator
MRINVLACIHAILRQNIKYPITPKMIASLLKAELPKVEKVFEALCKERLLDKKLGIVDVYKITETGQTAAANAFSKSPF